MKLLLLLLLLLLLVFLRYGVLVLLWCDGVCWHIGGLLDAVEVEGGRCCA